MFTRPETLGVVLGSSSGRPWAFSGGPGWPPGSPGPRSVRILSGPTLCCRVPRRNRLHRLLLIGELAFKDDPVLTDEVKAAVLIGSLIAAVLATTLLKVRNAKYRALCEAEELDEDSDGIPDIYEQNNPAYHLRMAEIYGTEGRRAPKACRSGGRGKRGERRSGMIWSRTGWSGLRSGPDGQGWMVGSAVGRRRYGHWAARAVPAPLAAGPHRAARTEQAHTEEGVRDERTRRQQPGRRRTQHRPVVRLGDDRHVRTGARRDRAGDQLKHDVKRGAVSGGAFSAAGAVRPFSLPMLNFALAYGIRTWSHWNLAHLLRPAVRRELLVAGFLALIGLVFAKKAKKGKGPQKVAASVKETAGVLQNASHRTAPVSDAVEVVARSTS